MVREAAASPPSLGTFTAGERARENEIGPILALFFAYATPVPTYSPLNAACHRATALHGQTKPSDRPPCLHKEDLCTCEGVSYAARVGCKTWRCATEQQNKECLQNNYRLAWLVIVSLQDLCWWFHNHELEMHAGLVIPALAVNAVRRKWCKKKQRTMRANRKSDLIVASNEHLSHIIVDLWFHKKTKSLTSSAN